MSLPLVVNALAEAEIAEARDQYEAARPGLGDDFLARLQAALDLIRQFPEMHAVVHADLRQARIRRFPYAIYYRVSDTQSTVVAVHHTSRDPGSWRSRA
jgi:plasmid stabilization system protein ParE